MPSTKKRSNFLESEEGVRAKQKLEAMVENEDFITTDGFSADMDQHPDGVISFVDCHMEYLRTHPQIQVDHYLANLRLRTRNR